MTRLERQRFRITTTEGLPDKASAKLLGVTERSIRRFHVQDRDKRKGMFRMTETVNDEISDEYDAKTINILET